MRRRFKSILLILMIAAGLSSCGEKPEPQIVIPEKRVVLGFAQLGDESEWRSESSRSIKEAAEAAGIQLIFEDALQKQENLTRAIRSFIVNRVDVIAFCPIVEDGWDNVLLEAKEADIPVILVDREIKTKEADLYTAYIGSDFVEEGRKAGRWLKEKFKNRPSSRPVKIAEIRGTKNSSPTIGRHNGFVEVLGDDPKFEIVASMTGDFMQSMGKECMEILLERNTEFDVLYSHNDDMALGAIEILEEQDIKPGKDVVIISVDAQKSAIQALKNGKINCLVECRPYVGEQLMEMVLKAANGEPLPKKTYTEESIYTEDDDFDSIPVRP